MATAKHREHVGTIACPCCNETIPVRKAENGTLSFPCAWCDFPGYAKSGTRANALMAKRVTFLEPAAPAPAAKAPAAPPVPAPVPPKPKAAPASVFHFGG